MGHIGRVVCRCRGGVDIGSIDATASASSSWVFADLPITDSDSATVNLNFFGFSVTVSAGDEVLVYGSPTR